MGVAYDIYMFMSNDEPENEYDGLTVCVLHGKHQSLRSGMIGGGTQMLVGYITVCTESSNGFALSGCVIPG